MKTKVTTALVLLGVLVFSNVQALTVPSPPGNIVQNGSFQSFFDYWGGLAAVVNNPNAPNARFGLGGDIYQDLSTTPGQQYSLVFYAAADLYFGPSATISVDLNHQTLMSLDTPPYAYIPEVHRYDQMRWQEYTASFTASAATTRLEFIDLNTYDFGLTAVSVVPIPEPSGMMLLFAFCAAIVGRKTRTH